MIRHYKKFNTDYKLVSPQLHLDKLIHNIYINLVSKTA